MRALLVLLALLSPLAAGAPATPLAAGGARVALVIGNASYKDSPLINPVNDARTLGAALRAAGFEVIELHNQNAAGMRRAIRDFGERLRGKDAGLFYFAGHGVQVRGRNFLVPVSSDIQYEDEIEDQSVDVNLVLGKMESAKARVSLVILDACRNNPYARASRSAQNGLAAIDAPIGTLIAFATSPGQVASDGTGSNGLYTQFLVREIGQPGLKVEDVFKRVRQSVRVASQGRQVPWENTSLEGDFYFYAPAVTDTAALESERARRQQAAIEEAVAAAVSRSKEEAEREKKRLESAFSERLETERAAMRREALERIAAVEGQAKAASAARTEAMSSPPEVVAAVSVPTLSVPAASAPAVAAPRLEPAPAVAAEPVLTPPQEDGKPAEMPPSFLAALGIDMDARNRLRGISEEVARGARNQLPKIGDMWVYFRELRDGEGTTRRNYLTTTVTLSNRDGYATSVSDTPIPGRYDPSGNRFSYGRGGDTIVFDPVEPLYRYPLAPGASWNTRLKELTPSGPVDVQTKVTVLGWEDVKVPAGTFRALKIASVSERAWEPFPGQQQQSKRVTSTWHVPALHNFAKMEVLEVNNRGVVIVDQNWELDFFQLP